MASKYCVDNKPPYFRTLAEARGYAINHSEHNAPETEALLEAGAEWCNEVYCNDRHAGTVVRLKEREARFDTTYYKWLPDGDDAWENIFSDGTRPEPTPASKYHISNYPLKGCFALSNGDEKLWVDGDLRTVLRYAIEGIKATETILPHEWTDTEIRTAYDVFDDGDKVVGFILQSKDWAAYGCLEGGWFEIKPTGALGKKLSIDGGPSLSGKDRPVMSGMPKDIIKMRNRILDQVEKMSGLKHREVLMEKLTAVENAPTEDAMMDALEEILAILKADSDEKIREDF